MSRQKYRDDWKKYNQNANDAIRKYTIVSPQIFDPTYTMKQYDRTINVMQGVAQGQVDSANSRNLKNNNKQKYLQQLHEAMRLKAEKAQGLSDYYDQEYNVKHDIIQRVNRDLTDKERLIALNNEYYRKKGRTVYILTSFLINFVLFAIVAFIVFGGNIRNKRILLYAGIFFALSWSISVFYKLWYSEEMRHIKNIENKTKATIKGMERAAALNLVPKYLIKKCPARCKPKEEKAPVAYAPDTGVLREMSTDSTQNVWLDGNKNSSTTVPPLGKTNAPQPWSDPLPSAKRYNCMWNGSDAGLLDKSKREFESTIPCQYFPGYVTK